MDVPPPADVVPLLEPHVADLYDALRTGIGFASMLQPDDGAREAWYWSHSARFAARRELAATDVPLVPDVPTGGIHLTLDGVHKARLLRSLWGSAPHPGHNQRRKDDWVGVQGQLRFPSSTNGAMLPPLSLLLDWQVDDEGEPEVWLSLPKRGWEFRAKSQLWWRYLLPPAADEFAGLVFDHPDDGGDAWIEIDPGEFGSG